jgi:UPF0716 family protein affecting phage T7 exclusion
MTLLYRRVHTPLARKAGFTPLELRVVIAALVGVFLAAVQQAREVANWRAKRSAGATPGKRSGRCSGGALPP